MVDASGNEASGLVPIWGKIMGLPEKTKKDQDGEEKEEVEGATGIATVGLIECREYGGWFGWLSRFSWKGGGSGERRGEVAFCAKAPSRSAEPQVGNLALPNQQHMTAFSDITLFLVRNRWLAA
jgi:hypothetical protein